ncbi:MAG TPA: SigE family RNA polymerase sigma factor, partial [Jatrophihabitantaceae bacterium]
AFRAFVETNGAALLHAARLLTGDHHRGEDLVQTALTRVYLKWDRIDTPLAYARKALVSAHIDSSRRRWWGEKPAETMPEVSAAESGDVDAADERDELRRLLAGLSPRERAVVVLRYYCDLSEQDTAATLSVPVGTVKSTCSRALSRLRVEIGVS